MTHPTRQEAPAGHRPGVFVEYDQTKMPTPPPDWIGVKFYDADGQWVGMGFVPPDHNDHLLSAATHAYVDARSTASEAASRPPLLRLVGP